MSCRTKDESLNEGLRDTIKRHCELIIAAFLQLVGYLPDVDQPFNLAGNPGLLTTIC